RSPGKPSGDRLVLRRLSLGRRREGRPSSALRSRAAPQRRCCNADVDNAAAYFQERKHIMDKSVRSKDEERFNKIKQQDIKALKEREKTQQEDAAKVTRLKALRLAKEAADKEAAEKEAAE